MSTSDAEEIHANGRRPLRKCTLKRVRVSNRGESDELQTINPTGDISRLREGESLGEESECQASDSDEQEWVAHHRPHRPSPSANIAQGASASLSAPISKKRTYRFIKRVANPRGTSRMRLRWMKLLDKTNDQLKQESCCKSRSCFKHVNIPFLRDKMGLYLALSVAERRAVLQSMTTSEGHFLFNGKEVCVTFLRKAFHFSPGLQSAIRRLPDDDVSQFSGSIKQAAYSAQSEKQSCSTDNTSAPSDELPPSYNSIILFIDRIVDDTAEMMPDTGESHLPFFRKEDVFEIFVRDFKTLYPKGNVPTFSYFTFVWKQHRSKVKVRHDTRFTKCTTCEQIRSALEDAIRTGKPTDDIIKRKKEHNNFIALERREYQRKRELAILRPTEYMSFVVDGADQSAYALPHFVTKVKDSRGHGLKVHLIGLLYHSTVNRLRLFTMTDEHQKGANHIIECIHRFVNDHAREGPLPRRLFVQLDNCTRENKNKYLLSYLEALVLWRVFDSVEVGFLPIGHTHSDIDQAFSTTSDRLRYHNAVTLAEMHQQVSNCYNEHTKVSTLKQICNWSGLCDKVRCNNNINFITQYRFFRFSLSETSMDSQDLSLITHVRSTCTEEWRSLESDNKEGVRSILKFLPNLMETPDEEIVSLPECEGKHFEDRIDSERGRIGSEVKIRSLLNLKKEVFRSRSVPFHWNMDTSIEVSSNVGRLDGASSTRGVADDAGNSLSSRSTDLEYKNGSFVAVLSGNSGQGEYFWIGRVIDVKRGRSRKNTSISVHWFTPYGSNSRYVCKYKPMHLQNNQGAKEEPWIDQISPESVLVSFKKLTSEKKLPALVSTHLREHFGSKKRQE